MCLRARPHPHPLRCWSFPGCILGVCSASFAAARGHGRGAEGEPARAPGTRGSWGREGPGTGEPADRSENGRRRCASVSGADETRDNRSRRFGSHAWTDCRGSRTYFRGHRDVVAPRGADDEKKGLAGAAGSRRARERIRVRKRGELHSVGRVSPRCLGGIVTAAISVARRSNASEIAPGLRSVQTQIFFRND